MVDLPKEWKDNKGNLKGLNQRSIMNKKVHATERGLTKTKLDGPIITIPGIKSDSNILTKDFKDKMDADLKTRSSQLTDSYFKNTPKLIIVKDCSLTGHYIPGFTTSKNDLNLRQREFNKIHKKNEFGFDRTATKALEVIKINPEDTVNNVEQKNKFNRVVFEARERVGTTPILPIHQERKKIIVKH